MFKVKTIEEVSSDWANNGVSSIRVRKMILGTKEQCMKLRAYENGGVFKISIEDYDDYDDLEEMEYCFLGQFPIINKDLFQMRTIETKIIVSTGDDDDDEEEYSLSEFAYFESSEDFRTEVFSPMGDAPPAVITGNGLHALFSRKTASAFIDYPEKGDYPALVKLQQVIEENLKREGINDIMAIINNDNYGGPANISNASPFSVYGKKIIQFFVYNGIGSISKEKPAELTMGRKIEFSSKFNKIESKPTNGIFEPIRHNGVDLGCVFLIPEKTPAICCYYPILNTIRGIGIPEDLVKALLLEGIRIIRQNDTADAPLDKTLELVISKIVRAKEEQVKKDITEAETEIRTKKQELMDLSLKYTRSWEAMQRINDGVTNLKEGLNKDITNLTRHKSIASARIGVIPNLKQLNCISQTILERTTMSNMELNIATKFLTYRSVKTGLLHGLGCFLVKVNLLNEEHSIVIKNLSWTRKGYWGDNCQAPHVNVEGHACYGNVQESLIEAQMRFDVVGMGYTLLSFLSSINEDDGAGRGVYRYPIILGDKILMNYMSDDNDSCALKWFRENFASSHQPPTDEKVIEIFQKYPRDSRALEFVPYVP